MHELLGQGVGLLECARRLGWALNTIKRYARAETAEQLQVLAEVVLAGVAGWPAGMTIVEAVDGFVVTNIAIGVSCGIAGVLVAWQRPRYPLGRLLLAAGVFQTTTAAAAPLIILGARRSIDTVFAYAWPWSIVLFIPLALLVFPDGLLRGRFWR